MRVLREGAKGPDVKQWQLFLIGQGFHPGPASGEFNPDTKKATQEFQRTNSLDPDGAVGNQTFGLAMMKGFQAAVDDDTSPTGPNFPDPPAFPPLASNAARMKIFGAFQFQPKPLPNNRENIVITDGWDKNNIVIVPVPQLAGIQGAPHDGRIQFHKLAQPQIVELWARWQKAKLLDRVLTWDGSFVPRFIRGSQTVLSNHSFGSAFDINVAWNPLGVEPPRAGLKGCVRELVGIANELGFYWGGHFKPPRLDGMHFEIAKLL